MVIIQGIYFYSIEEAAEILGVTKRTLYNWRSASDPDNANHRFALTARTSLNGRKYFREEEIIKILAECWGIEVSPETLRNKRSADSGT